MEEKHIRGTALYCGIGVTLEQMKSHLELAQQAGINALFTSLQLPEMEKSALLRDFPKMCELAHERNFRIAADVGARTADLFGIDLTDLRKIKDFGVDILRLDCGYTEAQTVELSHNDIGLEIQLNAAQATEDLVEYYVSHGINKDNVHWCHNYYPMRYTGLTPVQVQTLNRTIHNGGFRVAGFIPGQAHHRLGVSLGLPTLERHRTMPVSVAIQEAMLLGMDDIYFGDDLATAQELQLLANAKPGMVHFRMKPLVQAPEVMAWLDGRELKRGQIGLTHIVRSLYTKPEYSYKQGYDGGLVQPIRKGDVCMAKTPLLRYSGEVQIAKVDLPADENIGVIGHIHEEDIAILDLYGEDWTPFCLHIEA